MGNFKYLKDYHNNYVNSVISKIYGEPFNNKADMNIALEIIESVTNPEVKEWLYLKYIKNMTMREITKLKGWSRGKQYNLKCKVCLEV